MRVCLISMEVFAWGKHGGYGRATRVIGRELVGRGVEVFVVVPRRGNQQRVETLDGMTVLGFESRAPWRATDLLRECDADVYHSQEPSFTTYLAQKAMPHRKHVVTLRDTHEPKDWWTELMYPSLGRWQVIGNKLYEDNLLVQISVRRAHRVYCAAEFLRVKARRKYRLTATPEFLPTPIAVPAQVAKADRPTVCYLARWDRRKRPELFLQLAAKFPEIRFIAFGKARDADEEARLTFEYGQLPNLVIRGYVDQFASAEVERALSESWILVNTSIREGLPNAFLEAGAHGCAILSAVDPDGFASRFGVRVTSDDFPGGLTTLLRDNRWSDCGQRARQYVTATFELHRSMDQHLAIYQELTAGP
jgi:glycosyltransferase involved in cell wall biosynthesis